MLKKFYHIKTSILFSSHTLKKFAFLAAGGVTCLLTYFIPPSHSAVIITLAMIGKLCISSSFSLIYVYSGWSSSFGNICHYTMVDNGQEYRLKHWATRSSVRSHRSLVCLFRNTRFARALCCAHSLYLLSPLQSRQEVYWCCSLIKLEIDAEGARKKAEEVLTEVK